MFFHIPVDLLHGFAGSLKLLQRLYFTEDCLGVEVGIREFRDDPVKINERCLVLFHIHILCRNRVLALGQLGAQLTDAVVGFCRQRIVRVQLRENSVLVDENGMVFITTR